MKFNWKEIIFWVALIVSLILLAWYLFGSSPTELIALIAIIFTVIMKMWSVSDRQIKLENKLKIRDMRVKDSFMKVKDSFINVERELSSIKGDLSLIKKKLKV